MKRVLLTLTVLGSLFLGACEKEELTAPVDKALIKADKGILCRGCAQWDLVEPGAESGTTTYRSAGSADTTVNPAKSVKPSKGIK